MAPRKQQRTKNEGISLPSSDEISPPENSGGDSRTEKLDLVTLLAETPEHSIDFNWGKMAPVGREFR